MRIVRVGGRYLEDRERRLWGALVVIFGLALAGVVLGVNLKASLVHGSSDPEPAAPAA